MGICDCMQADMQVSKAFAVGAGQAEPTAATGVSPALAILTGTVAVCMQLHAGS